MPRRKMTEEEKAARDRKKDEERRKDNLVASLARLREEAKRNTEPQFMTPTRHFEVGDMVHMGNHDNVQVMEATDDGFYLVHIWGVHDVYTKKDVPYESWHWETWHDLLPLPAARNLDQPVLSFRDEIDLHYMSQDFHSLLGYHRRGVDYSPSYQRGHAWNMAQRLALMDSVFQNIDIGKFVFIDLGYKDEGPMMEILDGKQRLATIVAFYEDRFPYKGLHYSEMHSRDRYHFKSSRVSVAMAERMTKAQRYRYFLKLNVAGEPQDPNHIAHVQHLLDKLEAEQKS